MKTPRLPTISLTPPGSGMLLALGIILLADALAHVILAMPFANFPGGGFFDYTLFVFALVLASSAAITAGFVLVVAIVCATLLGQAQTRSSDERFAKAVLLIHISVLIRSTAASVNLLSTMEGGILSPAVVWTSLVSSTLVLVLLNGLNWDVRHAALGVVASIVTLGCAVWYAPAIYGWDLRPMGWYAILASTVPVLAFLALFLRGAPVFSKSRWLRLGTAAALFAALAYAVGAHMAENPPDVAFSENLQTALSERPPQIRFSDLTDFEWDEVELYNGYTFREDFSALALESVDIVSRSHLGYNEVGDLAVFIKDGEVVYYEMVWQHRHTFVSPGSPVVLTPQDAVFNVEYEPEGYRVLSRAE